MVGTRVHDAFIPLTSSLCIPYLVLDCNPPCVNGTCDLLVGDCRCEDGYIGGDCGTAIGMQVNSHRATSLGEFQWGF